MCACACVERGPRHRSCVAQNQTSTDSHPPHKTWPPNTETPTLRPAPPPLLLPASSGCPPTSSCAAVGPCSIYLAAGVNLASAISHLVHWSSPVLTTPMHHAGRLSGQVRIDASMEMVDRILAACGELEQHRPAAAQRLVLAGRQPERADQWLKAKRVRDRRFDSDVRQQPIPTALSPEPTRTQQPAGALPRPPPAASKKHAALHKPALKNLLLRAMQAR